MIKSMHFKVQFPECQFSVYDFAGSLTPIFVHEEMKHHKPEELDKPRLIIDLGANVGMWSFRMACKYPDTKIIALEPVELNAVHLQHGIDLNGFKNIDVRRVGVTKDGRDLLLGMDGNNSGSAAAFNTDEMFSKFEVPTISLNDLFEQLPVPVDLMKVDIEGAEFEIFEGFKHWDKLKRIFIEVHPFAICMRVEPIRELVDMLHTKLGVENVVVDCSDKGSKFRFGG